METWQQIKQSLQAGWANPERTYRSHTRWWWPGNALTKQDISWQMEEMAAKGFGGVEIMNAWKYYEKGNHEYLSPKHLELVKHAIEEGKRLDLEVALTFGPGWSFGGSWVSKEDQSKCLMMTTIDVIGPAQHAVELPLPKGDEGQLLELHSLVAVVAGRLIGEDTLAEQSLTVLTGMVDGGKLKWHAPAGEWRIMAFHLMYTGQVCQSNNFTPLPMVIDHLSKGAVERYVHYLGSTFKEAFGSEFGKTVDSLFCDSFEILTVGDGLLWSGDTLAGFERFAGYDLTPYLTALWLDVPPITPRIRYDVNHYLHQVGMDVFYKTFHGWCEANQVQARVQPHYRYTTEIIQASGSIPRPETEVSTDRFETVADPRKATVSGARFYGSSHVSAESYTFLNKHRGKQSRYHAPLQQLKVATDAFLRDGITQIYNHGYFASPEKQLEPTRDFPHANLINHQNTWWKHFRCLADYVGRSSFLLRQGKFVADVLIYSPQATAWTEKTNWGWEKRTMNYGDVPKTLLANGYDYDVINDDLLQNYASIDEGRIVVNGYAYRVLILPAVSVMPLRTAKFIDRFVQAGGAVIALEKIPFQAPGLKDYEERDGKLAEMMNRLFGPDGAPTAHFLAQYAIKFIPLQPGQQPYTPTPPLPEAGRELLQIINQYTQPDFVIGYHEQSNGLTFIHRRVDEMDIYFVTNLQPASIAADISFAVTGKAPERWDPLTGDCKEISNWQIQPSGTVIPLKFEAWESVFIVFVPSNRVPESNPLSSLKLPDPIEVTGTWRLQLEGDDFAPFTMESQALGSWTQVPQARYFSGTGRYDIEFTLPDSIHDQGCNWALELGRVEQVAEVELNDVKIGTAWMHPYRVDVTKALVAGTNKLSVFVTNAVLNRVVGTDRIAEIPTELQDRLGTRKLAEEGSILNMRDELWKRMSSERKYRDDMLVDSGLLGSVRLIPTVD